ncbi:GTPase-activating protein S13 [Thoreauomyces humboldtii]|nr:GTPase-activating protein S13 [Thoreauomyces humboldtii]
MGFSATAIAVLTANAIYAQAAATAASTDPAVVGSWVKFAPNTGVVPIHAAYSPGDKLFFNERLHYLGLLTDGFSAQDLVLRNATGWYSGNPNLPSDFLTDSAEYDFSTNTYTLINHTLPMLEQDGKNQGYAFCSGHCQLANGSYLVVGGDQFWGRIFNNVSRTSDGRRDIRVMIPSNGTTPPSYQKVAEINNVNNLGLNDDRSLWGRWYPSVLLLPNEDVMILGGQRAFYVPDNSSWNNPYYEIYHPSTGVSDTPVPVALLARNFPVNMYPVAYVLPKSGKIWAHCNNDSAIIDMAANTETQGISMDASQFDGLLGRSFPFSGTNFLPMLTLASGYKMESWFCGGVNGTAADGTQTPRAGGSTKWYANCPNCLPTARCHYLDLETDGAKWIREDMPIARSQPTAVNLPDGTIAIFSGSGLGHQGGVFGQPVASQGVKPVVIFNPMRAVGDPARWTVGPDAPTARHYHNTALLREDGTVVTGGGDSQNGDSPNTLNPTDMTLDVYTPAYKYASNITVLAPLATSVVTYGQSIIVPFTSAVAQNISRVTIIRYASVTHTVNLDQRHIELEVVKYAVDKLLVRMPPNSTVAIPGNWMLWPIDSRGIPSNRSALLNLRASNPGGDAMWNDADTVATPVFSNPYVDTAEKSTANSAGSGAVPLGWGSAVAAGLAVAATTAVNTFDTQHEDLIHDAQLDYYGRRLATCSSDRTIKIYEIDGESQRLVDTLRGHEGPVWQVAWAHPKYGNVLASCSYDAKVAVWKEKNGAWTRVWEHSTHTASVNSIAWAPHEFGLILAAASSDGKVSLSTCNETGTWETVAFQAHSIGCNSVTWAPSTTPGTLVQQSGNVPPNVQKRFATAGCDNLIKIWRQDSSTSSVSSWTEETTLEGHTDWVRDIAFAPNVGLPGTYLASCSQDKTVVIWVQDASAQSSTGTSAVSSAATTSTGQPQQQHGWAKRTLKRDAFPDVVWRVSWSTSGNILAVSCGDNKVTLWKENLEGEWALVGGENGGDAPAGNSEAGISGGAPKAAAGPQQ